MVDTNIRPPGMNFFVFVRRSANTSNNATSKLSVK